MTSPVRYTLVEHENLPGYVKPIAVTPEQETRARAHQGVIFNDFNTADKAAYKINDDACEGVGVTPSKPSHLLGFTPRYRINGSQLYMPVRAPAGAV